MPRGQRIDIGAPPDSPAVRQTAGGLVAPRLATHMDYMSALEAVGVERDPATGNLIHWMSAGTAMQNGRAVGRVKKFNVALSLDEARERTRATGDRWDYYVDGLKCRECTGPLRGWALGGRKLQSEHDHVVEATPELYRVVELDDDDSGAMAEADDPVAVGA